MKEARGNMLTIDCDALVVTTNGFVKRNGECVMGRGIAKQVADIIPQLPKDLGSKLTQLGNKVHMFTYPNFKEVIVTFPVKPTVQMNDGTNVVKHKQNQFKLGDMVPGFAVKADPYLIEKSLEDLVRLTDAMGWTNVVCPRFGCGAGELNWKDIKPMVEQYLDDRFTIYTH